MLLRNFKSSADEALKRNLLNDILKVEIENESILEQRVGDFQNKNLPPPVPPQYKTNAEMMKDLVEQEKRAIDNLMSMDFEYNDASKIVAWLNGGDRLIKFNQGFPLIKSDILKKFNPKLINPEFMEDYLNKYFDEIDVTFGFSFDRQGGVTINTIKELREQVPSIQLIDSLASTLQANGKDMEGEDLTDIFKQLTTLRNVLPTDRTIAEIDTFPANQKRLVLNKIYQGMKKANIPSVKEIDEIITKIYRYDSQSLIDSQRNLGKALNKRLSGISNKSTSTLQEIVGDVKSFRPVGVKNLYNDVDEYFDLIKEINSIDTRFKNEAELEIRAKQLHELNQRYGFQDADGNLLNDYSVEEIMQLIEEKFSRDRQVRQQLRELEEIPKIKPTQKTKRMTMEGVQSLISEVKDYSSKFSNSQINNMIKQTMEQFDDEEIQNSKGSLTMSNVMGDNTKTKTELKKEIYFEYLKSKLLLVKDYDRALHAIYQDPANRSFGFGVKKGKGVKKALKKHFKEDEKFLKKVAEEMDSSSDEEVMAELKKHSKREKPYEKKIEKTIGEGYIHKRIPVKKVVGKGIEVEKQPTYKTFGKYVLHIPFLTNNNVLNLKYPSLGAIPSIKPMTVSDDYRDFVIDVMNTGRFNDKLFNQLQSHEQKHFDKIVKGAGLADVFKIKRATDDEDKEDEKRFNLLRGNFLAGNNSDSVIKELKGLVIKFINEGRLGRKEGTDLLMELSVF